jgi:hypothetical protein
MSAGVTGPTSALTTSQLCLPFPLLEPDRWPRELPGLVPLELVISVGGPLREYFDEVALLPGSAVRVSLASFRGQTGSIQTRLRVEEAAKWLIAQRVSRLALVDGSLEDFFAVFGSVLPARPFELVAVAPMVSSLESWALAFAPALAAEALKALAAYAKEFPQAKENPWEGLRFFSGFLKTRKVDGAVIFARGYAQAQALHSPQGEATERASLRDGETMLNPTLQLVSSASGVEGFWRSEGKLKSKQLDRPAAGLIDELHEGGRVALADLLARASQHSGASIAETEATAAALKMFGLLL